MRHISTSIRNAIRQALDVRDIIRQVGTPRPLTPRQFKSTRGDGGAFGHWTVDQAGLPAYAYTLDQYADDRARYPDTQWPNRRDHWHQIGNHHITALASNDGVVQVYLGDCGGAFLNRFEARGRERRGGPPLRLMDHLLRLLRYVARLLTNLFLVIRKFRRNLRAARLRFRARNVERKRGGPVISPRGLLLDEKVKAHRAEAEAFAVAGEQAALPSPYAFAGGFGYIDDGTQVWATAFRYRPPGAQPNRVFGVGYFETDMIYRGIRQTRRVYAPLVDAQTLVDDPVILIDIELENQGATPVDVRYYEYWDVNVYQLKLQWERSGSDAERGDRERFTLNRQFTCSIQPDETWQLLLFRQKANTPLPANLRAQPSEIDHMPADVFLADLVGPPSGKYTHKASFFGAGGATQPDAVKMRREADVGQPDRDDPMPFCLVLRRDLRLEPGQPVRLRYAYGVARLEEGHTLDFLGKYRDGDPLADTLKHWKERLAYFADADPSLAALQRETAWHAYYLQSATVYNLYYQAYLIPQGSAYLYLHGADGAPRDQSLFVLPLTYVDPELARQTLCLIMRLTSAQTGAIPYAFAGAGWQSDALGVHAKPSDLDLFFLLALSEYLAATGDLDFLSEPAPFYPLGDPTLPPGARGITVLDHARAAVTHLFEMVGIGEHDLIRIGDGDWSDGVVLEALLTNVPEALLSDALDHSINEGESAPNTQMALYVLPLAAALVESRCGIGGDDARAFGAPAKRRRESMERSRQVWLVHARHPARQPQRTSHLAGGSDQSGGAGVGAHRPAARAGAGGPADPVDLRSARRAIGHRRADGGTRAGVAGDLAAAHLGLYAQQARPGVAFAAPTHLRGPRPSHPERLDQHLVRPGRDHQRRLRNEPQRGSEGGDRHPAGRHVVKPIHADDRFSGDEHEPGRHGAAGSAARVRRGTCAQWRRPDHRAGPAAPLPAGDAVAGPRRRTRTYRRRVSRGGEWQPRAIRPHAEGSARDKRQP